MYSQCNCATYNSKQKTYQEILCKIHINETHSASEIHRNKEKEQNSGFYMCNVLQEEENKPVQT